MAGLKSASISVLLEAMLRSDLRKPSMRILRRTEKENLDIGTRVVVREPDRCDGEIE
jgi:hypothetical protein